jgi:hypothetical protein
MRTSSPIWSRSTSDGFVLVGVLMFILVLTILGLTLFSLSSIEAQFFYRSNDDLTAFYSALSGIERAKFVLSATNSLAKAQSIGGVPIEGLEYTVAKQGTDFNTADSSGAVNWDNGTQVWIRSLAVVNGERALVEARFTPHAKNTIYQRLFTLSDPAQGLSVDAATGHQIQLAGPLVQSSTDVTFLTAALVPPSPYSVGAAVSSPDLAGYFGQWWSGASVIVPNIDGNGTDTYNLNATNSQDQVAFFKTPLSLHDDQINPDCWSLEADYGNPGRDPNVNTASITVHGTCIWLFDHGARFYKRLIVYGSGGANDALVLVSGVNLTTKDDAGEGVLFKSGLSNPGNVPIVLVSSGGVGIQHSVGSAPQTNTVLGYLSVFAAGSDIEGPDPGFIASLSHPAGAPQDYPGGVIGRLVEDGYLPNTTTSTTGDFTPIAGAWHEIKSTDGSY